MSASNAYDTLWANVGTSHWDEPDGSCQIPRRYMAGVLDAMDELRTFIGAPEAPARDDLIALIHWLAIPYGADPAFVTADEPPYPGITTDYRLRLRATWEAVVGTKGPAPAGVWGTCQTCGSTIFLRDTTDLVEMTPDAP